MKTQITRATSFALIGLMIAGPAMAGPGDRSGQNIGRLFNAIDANGDKVIEFSEMAAAKARAAGKIFVRIDTDASGSIDRSEFDAAADHLQEIGEQIGPKIRACIAEFKERHPDIEFPPAPERPDRDTVFMQLDQNADGSIDLNEFTQGNTEKAAKLFDRIDQNNDGVVDQREFTTAAVVLHKLRRAIRICLAKQHNDNNLVEDLELLLEE